jgi:hypothetical protein
VNRSRDEFLAGTGFADDQNRRVSRRDLLVRFDHAAQAERIADDL